MPNGGPRSLVRGAALLVVLLLATPARATGSHPLGWLSGCWSTPDGDSVEVWRIDGDGLVGFAVTVEAGRVTFYETLAIRGRDGQYVYTAWPSEQRETAFSAARIETGLARFTNPAHDYPQVIEYTRSGNALVATISMLDGTRARRFEKRRCEDIDD